jgi:hypothetical protein
VTHAYIVLLVLSGYLHAGEMAVDNLLSARMGGMNGNLEHLCGDVLGWFLIASLALLFLILDRQGTRGAVTHLRVARPRGLLPKPNTEAPATNHLG